MQKPYSISAALVTVCLLWATAVGAQGLRGSRETQVNEQAREIYSNTMSPYCPGATLSACTSPAAKQLRMKIAKQLARGETPQAVRSQLIEQFGQTILGVPKETGFGMVGWLAPGVAVLIGLMILIISLRAMLAKQQETIASKASLSDGREVIDDAIRRRIEDEIKQRMGQT